MKIINVFNVILLANLLETICVLYVLIFYQYKSVNKNGVETNGIEIEWKWYRNGIKVK